MLILGDERAKLIGANAQPYVNSAVPRSARAGRIRLLVPPSVAAVTLAYHRLPYYPAKTVVRGFAAGLGRVVPLVHVVELLTGPRLSCWHPGETSPTDRLMRAGVHGNERSISISVSISVSIVLRERSGAMMVLGMSPGTSDVMSGVGRVIRISGTRPKRSGTARTLEVDLGRSVLASDGTMSACLRLSHNPEAVL